MSLLLFTLYLSNLEVYKAAGKCSVVDQTSKCSVVSVIAAALDFPLIYPSVFVVHKRNSKSWISSLYGKVQKLRGVTKKCPEYDQVIEKLKQCLWISNPQGNGNIIYTRVWLMCEWLHKINANTWGSSIACSCCDSKHVSDRSQRVIAAINESEDRVLTAGYSWMIVAWHRFHILPRNCCWCWPSAECWVFLWWNSQRNSFLCENNRVSFCLRSHSAIACELCKRIDLYRSEINAVLNMRFRYLFWMRKPIDSH